VSRRRLRRVDHIWPARAHILDQIVRSILESTGDLSLVEVSSEDVSWNIIQEDSCLFVDEFVIVDKELVVSISV